MNSRSQSLPVAGQHIDFLQGGWVDAADWICGPLAPCDAVDLVSASSKLKTLLYQVTAAEDAVGSGSGWDGRVAWALWRDLLVASFSVLLLCSGPGGWTESGGTAYLVFD